MVCSIGPGIDEIDTASTAEVVRKYDARKDVLSKDLDAIDDICGTYSKSLAGDFVYPEQAERFFEGLLSRSRAMTSTVLTWKSRFSSLPAKSTFVVCRKEARKDGWRDIGGYHGQEGDQYRAQVNLSYVIIYLEC
jgi:hypothetical protein